MSVGEANKLVGISNYYIWHLRMKTIVKKENVWDITKNHVQLKITNNNVGYKIH